MEKIKVTHQKRPRADHKRRRSSIAGAIAIAAIALCYFGTSQSHSHRYALCSKSQDIYTVDESNPRVECILVHGSRIVDTGGLGNLSPAVVS